MRPRILSYRFTATHDWIAPLSGLSNDLSISDFDAFVFDPLTQEPMTFEVFQRRVSELQDLIHKKGGIIICTLRPETNVGVPNLGEVGRYGLLRATNAEVSEFIRRFVKGGEGSQLKVLTPIHGPAAGFFEVLKGNLRFAAYLQADPGLIVEKGGTPLAVNSVGYPISAGFSVGEGLLCFIPIAHDVTADRMGAAIVRIVRAHFEKQAESETPEWVRDVTVPGATVHDQRLIELVGTKDQLEREIARLQEKRDELLGLAGLLYGYGKVILERQARVAFRIFGFTVPEPEEYTGEWDISLLEPESNKTILGEVEGSEGPIDVDKYRQLLDYIEAEALEGREHKGILVGNGFRLQAPDAGERQQQFTDHALRGAARNGFCLMPTTEIFKAVCAVLEATNAEGLKIEIRDSIFKTVGVWKFQR